MRILAIDPGTHCGWAWTEDGAPHAETSGVWDLSSQRHEGGGMRFLRLAHWLHETKADLIVYEEVARHRGTAAAHVYGGIVGQIGVYCEQRGVPYTAIPVGTIKKHATGKGNADKSAMLHAAKVRWGDRVESHDQADALHILDCYLATMGQPQEAA